MALATTGHVSLSELSKLSGLSIDQLRRGIEWLRSKQLISVQESDLQLFSLGEEGKVMVKQGLPERRLVDLVKKSGGSEIIRAASKHLGNEFAIALGNAKKNGWLRVENNKIFLWKDYDNREREEDVLEKIAGEGGISRADLTSDDLEAISSLKKRQEGFVKETHDKTVTVGITESGKNALLGVSADEIDRITPKLLQSGEWKDRTLRSIDVTSPAPSVYPGRRHPMRLFMNEVREAFISVGFEEILGPISQSALWNFDALFIPQQHPAREMQDTFYVSSLKARLQKYDEEVRAIRESHERGGSTGSRGWRYEWSTDEASRVVLRTHTTAVTISYLAENKPDDARVFSVGRVFRNEKSNYKHNPEFYQIEGVMVG